jgi:hypothetical protein
MCGRKAGGFGETHNDGHVRPVVRVFLCHPFCYINKTYVKKLLIL